MLRETISRAIGSLRRRRLEQECDEEVRAHLEMLTDRFIARGVPPEEAYYAARKQFGGVTQFKQDLRERRALPPIDVLVQDVLHAFRQLRKAKGFTAAAALTLALGIGASTAVFAVVDAVILRPLPFASPERLMSFDTIDRRNGRPSNLSYPTFFDLRAQNHVFERLVSYRDSRFTLSDSLPAIQVVGQIVSWDMFPLLGVQPQIGRGFLPDEEKSGHYAVILSDSLWKARFGGDPSIVNKSIRVNGHASTVAGVARPGFRFPADAPEVQLWATLAEDSTRSEYDPLSEQRGARVLNTLGRLKRGISSTQAQAQMDVLTAGLARQYPDDNGNVPTAVVLPELERLVHNHRGSLWILLGAVSLLLLIGCANVANLLLARATGRAREFALRSALGGSRGALTRQLLLESLALSTLAAIGGVFLAMGILKLILPMAGDSIPRIAQATVDLSVLAFSIGAAVLTSILFSLAPLVQVLRTNASVVLKSSAWNIAHGRNRFRSGLVVGQIMSGLLLLVGAEVLIAGFFHLWNRDPGFRADHLLTFDLGESDAQHGVARQIAFCDSLVEHLRAIPGVQAVATGTPLPLDGHQMTISFDIEERRSAPSARSMSDIAIVTPGYFGTIGIPIRKGRDFTERDDVSAPRVLVVNEAFARKFFPGEDALGKRIESGATNGHEGTQLREIVGIVGNAKQDALGNDPDPIYYFPYKQLSWGIGTIVLRTAVPPEQIESAARTVVAGLDPQAAMFQIRTGQERSSRSIAGPRFATVLMGSFASIALLLTVIGLYGVLSYSVARRRRELGVRIALGAGRREVVALVLREAIRLVGVGLVFGIVGAIAAARLLESTVFGVQPGMPSIVAIACGLMVLTGMAAGYIPASRAGSVDPIETLRSE